MMVRAILKMVMLGAMVFSFNTGVVNAALVGGIGITGNYTDDGDLSDDTTLTLNTAMGTSGTGDFTSVYFGLEATSPNDGSSPGSIFSTSSFSFKPFSSVDDVLAIGGWQLDLTSLAIIDQTSSLLTFEGTGFLSNLGNPFESTAATWTFSAQTGSSYSMSITAVPLPAAVWLFGSGLIGLVGLARKKA